MNIAINNKVSVDENEQHDLKNEINGKVSFRYPGIWPPRASYARTNTAEPCFSSSIAKITIVLT